MAKVERSYQHVDPASVGNEGRLVVSELGGRANTQLRAEQLGHKLEGVVDARALSVIIKRLESDGLAFEGAEASFELLVRRNQPGYVAPFRIVDFTVLVEQRDGQELRAEATVKVAVDGETLHTAADGNGPVNALDTALRKALGAFYPVLDDVHLVDYKVRILDGEAATGARTRVVIDSRDGDRTWSTMGSDTNIIAASCVALGRLARVRDLEVRRPAPTARRAPLHHRDSDPPEVRREPQSRPATRRRGRADPASRAAGRSRPAAIPGAGARSSSAPGDHAWDAVAEGNGPVDALFRAVDAALAGVLAGHPRLVAYDIHAVAEGPDSEGIVTVTHRTAGRRRRATGRAAATGGKATSTNIIAASIEAYLEAINALLAEEHWQGATETAGNKRRAKGATQRRAEMDEDEGHHDTTAWFER